MLACKYFGELTNAPKIREALYDDKKESARLSQLAALLPSVPLALCDSERFFTTAFPNIRELKPVVGYSTVPEFEQPGENGFIIPKLR